METKSKGQPSFSNGLPTKNESERMRLRDDECRHILTLMAAQSDIKKSMECSYFVNRMKSIPHGWRDLCMINAVTDKLLDKILDTVPTKKLVGLHRLLPRCTYNIIQGKVSQSQLRPNEEVISGKELDALVFAAWDGKCKLCDSDCDRCELGKTLDTLVIQDRGDGSWSTIDITRKERV